MLTAIKGYYEHGKIVLSEQPPLMDKTEVVVTFLSAEKSGKEGKRKLGGFEGRINLPDDFNDPLEDLKDYM